ncbi:Protein GUCD1 [Gracilariopsis chorda]|uniref:Protein GUCD1 n=1 Tax=Gracilariopsis chorda TaxID=448386 RepID=A0A2V3J2H1_9FLOR|nr:Protein GUCD1 [Gracilariopsis chorda]|eukprot:PXF48641.1 Protein GUCD1 [Gracilariopsis chorda]
MNPKRITEVPFLYVHDGLQDFIALQKDLVPYIHQVSNWDCGLACILMALRARGNKQVTLNDLARCCKREATWSIDIAYLLRDYGLECVFYTITRGVRPEYFFQSFYKRLLDTCDTERVIERFRNAERSGVKVIERTSRH